MDHRVHERWIAILQMSSAMRLRRCCPSKRTPTSQWKEFQAHVNNELGRIFGNFANRMLTFAARHFEGQDHGQPQGGDERECAARIFRHTAKEIAALYERYRLREDARDNRHLARAANKYFNDAEPWRLLRKQRGSREGHPHMPRGRARTCDLFRSDHADREREPDEDAGPLLYGGELVERTRTEIARTDRAWPGRNIISKDRGRTRGRRVATANNGGECSCGCRPAAETKPAANDGLISIDDFEEDQTAYGENYRSRARSKIEEAYQTSDSCRRRTAKDRCRYWREISTGRFGWKEYCRCSEFATREVNGQ